MSEPSVLTVPEAARRVGISESVAYQRVACGHWPSVRRRCLMPGFHYQHWHTGIDVAALPEIQFFEARRRALAEREAREAAERERLAEIREAPEPTLLGEIPVLLDQLQALFDCVDAGAWISARTQLEMLRARLAIATELAQQAAIERALRGTNDDDHEATLADPAGVSHAA